MSRAIDKPDVVVAGHICLDVIPTFEYRAEGLGTLIAPGELVEVGPSLFATGGAVSNTGLALHRLGISTRLIGKVGDDLFGRAILNVLRGYGKGLGEGMIVATGEPSSYTLVVSPPGVDRVFFHCPGVNDTFHPREVPIERLRGTRLLHFGYPPLMRATYADGGAALAELFRAARAEGLIVSLDMARPDPSAPSGQVNWAAWMERVLPEVDVFGPSFEELLFMLDRPQYDRLVHNNGSENLIDQVDGAVLHGLADRLLEMGASIVVIKVGEVGLYLRTTNNERLFARFARLQDGAVIWQGRELLHPCFRVKVVGTTGAGDATLAGFLAGLLHGQEPEAALRSAVAVGACSVEAADATSGVPAWADIQARIYTGWSQRQMPIDNLPAWGWQGEHGLWHGSHDAAR